MIPAGRIGLERSTSADQVDDENDYGDDEQDVNEAAHRVRADNAQQPEHQQDNEDCPEHSSFLRLFSLCSQYERKVRLLK